MPVQRLASIPSRAPRQAVRDRGLLGLSLAVLALAAAACGSAGPTATLPPLTGNGAVVALPTDAPAAVRSLSAMFECGAQELGEKEEAGTSTESAPAPSSQPASESASESASDSASEPAGPASTSPDPGAQCIVHAWETRRPAEFSTNEARPNGDAIYTIYRVASDGTVVLLTRAWSSFDRRATWTRIVCHGLSLDDEGLTPQDCGAPIPLS